jgi:hypothetical protein
MKWGDRVLQGQDESKQMQEEGESMGKGDKMKNRKETKNLSIGDRA